MILPQNIFVARSVSEGYKNANAIFAAMKTKKAKKRIWEGEAPAEPGVQKVEPPFIIRE